MDWLLIILRIIHIFGGVFWFGAAVMLAFFIEPTTRAAGAEGQRYIQRLFGGKLPIVISIAAGLNVLAGLVLYWRDSAGLSASWISTGTGLGFTIGGIAAIAAGIAGFGISRPAATRLGMLGQQLQQSGKPPSPEQLAEMRRLGERVSQATLWTAVFLMIALLAMSSARYL